MPTSSSPKRPLVKTYRIEHALIEEHTLKLRQAHSTWGRPICPDCYQPAHLCKHMKLEKYL